MEKVAKPLEESGPAEEAEPHWKAPENALAEAEKIGDSAAPWILV